MRYQDTIARALATPGGHLAIGRGGFTLHYDDSRLSGYDCDTIKQEAIEAGLPVIDSRPVPYAVLARLAVEGPMVAVNRPAHPEPWHAFSDAPLAVVATAYRQVGADIHNIADDPRAHAWFAGRPTTPLDQLVDGWLDYVLGPLVAHEAARGDSQ